MACSPFAFAANRAAPSLGPILRSVALLTFGSAECRRHCWRGRGPLACPPPPAEGACQVLYLCRNASNPVPDRTHKVGLPFRGGLLSRRPRRFPRPRSFFRGAPSTAPPSRGAPSHEGAGGDGTSAGPTSFRNSPRHPAGRRCETYEPRVDAHAGMTASTYVWHRRQRPALARIRPAHRAVVRTLRDPVSEGHGMLPRRYFIVASDRNSQKSALRNAP